MRSSRQRSSRTYVPTWAESYVNCAGVAALIVNGTPDHVHMLVRMPTLCSVAEMVRVVKANSSRWVHEKWPNHRYFGWQTGYGAFSVSPSNVNAVTKYIAEQEEHHRRTSFQEEFLAFLQKNGVMYDERYLWG